MLRQCLVSLKTRAMATRSSIATRKTNDKGFIFQPDKQIIESSVRHGDCCYPSTVETLFSNYSYLKQQPSPQQLPCEGDYSYPGASYPKFCKSKSPKSRIKNILSATIATPTATVDTLSGTLMLPFNFFMFKSIFESIFK